MTEAQKTVSEYLGANRLVLFSKTFCPFCTKVKQVLQKYNSAGLTVVELDGRGDMDAIQDYLQTLTGGRTVPRVFLDGKFIGGCEEVVAKERAGEVAKMIGN